MRGQIVVVKDVNGDALLRRVWDYSTRGVYILVEEEWKKRMSGEKSLDPVGFPITDVFLYDAKAKKQMKSRHLTWEALTPFSPDAKIAA